MLGAHWLLRCTAYPIRLEHAANRSAALWLKWFETLKEFPPLQAPASYNLTQVMDAIKTTGGHPSD